MKVVVLGAGVVGVCSAYELACDGHDVTVIERREDVGLDTSFANGGQLSTDHGEPLAAPGVLKKALKWLGDRDAPLLYRLHMDPGLWSWTLKFLSNANEPHFWRNAEHMLRVSQYSRERMTAVLKRETIAFDHATTGILTLYQNPHDFDQALEHARTIKELGAERKSLDRKGCIELEPALAHSTILLSGGIYTPHDESGDCHAFTAELADRCKRRGVKFQFNTTVTGFEKDGWKVTAANTDQGAIGGDVFIVALGSYSTLLMNQLDLKLPIYPTKGYSVTFPVNDDAMAPKMSLTSNDYKLVFSRLGNKLRVAGMMEFMGYDNELNEQRAHVVLENALKLFPRAGERDHASFWSGLRPMTPDGVPVLGRGKQENVILNTGHGMLGWTMAMGSARITADLVCGRMPEIEMNGLGWERFS